MFNGLYSHCLKDKNNLIKTKTAAASVESYLIWLSSAVMVKTETNKIAKTRNFP